MATAFRRKSDNKVVVLLTYLADINNINFTSPSSVKTWHHHFASVADIPEILLLHIISNTAFPVVAQISLSVFTSIVPLPSRSSIIFFSCTLPKSKSMSKFPTMLQKNQIE